MNINEENENNNIETNSNNIPLNNIDPENAKNIILISNPSKAENDNTNKRYYQNEEQDPSKNDSNNYIELFNEVIKSIDKIIFKKNEKEDNVQEYKKSTFMYNSINEEDIDYNQLSSEGYNIIYDLHSKNINITLLKDNSNNNIAQYYKSSGLILVSLEIINIYYKIYRNEIEGETKFFEWLINDNKEGENVLEIGIGIQTSPKDQIAFYKKIFEYIEKSTNKKIIYKIIQNRKDNIFLLCAKEEKLFLLLFLYDKIKQFYPSSNPLDIKNKLGLVPLHFSSYYLNREITGALLTLDCQINIEDKNGNIPLHFAVKGGDLSIVKKLLLYGSDKNKVNNNDMTPIDYANKFGNNAMKNLFTNNPIYKIDKIKDKRHDKLLFIFFVGCFILKYIFYNYFWKSYIIDIFCLLFFLYFTCRKKDYYLNPENYKINSKDITIEKLLDECDYDKNKIRRICPKCKLIKSFNMKHCMICDICVEEFDHHCFWINKCINNKIFFQFILFLIAMLIDTTVNFFLFLKEVKKFFKEKKDRNIVCYLKIIFSNIYLFIFAFGVILIIRMLSERIQGLIYSKKKMNLEENLLNKKNDDEDDNENKENKKDNNKDNNKIIIKEDNKEDDFKYKDFKI